MWFSEHIHVIRKPHGHTTALVFWRLTLSAADSYILDIHYGIPPVCSSLLSRHSSKTPSAIEETKKRRFFRYHEANHSELPTPNYFNSFPVYLKSEPAIAGRLSSPSVSRANASNEDFVPRARFTVFSYHL